MNSRDSASEQSTPESTDTAIPVEERSTNPYPKPVRRSRTVAEEPELPDFDSLTLPESSLSDMPLTNNALFEALGLTPPDAGGSEAPDPGRSEASDPTGTTTRVPVTATAPTVAPTTTARRGSRPAADKRAPIWSEDWDAWIYWDTTLRTWFRHDMQRGTWVPMDED